MVLFSADRDARPDPPPQGGGETRHLGVRPAQSGRRLVSMEAAARTPTPLPLPTKGDEKPIGSIARGLAKAGGEPPRGSSANDQAVIPGLAEIQENDMEKLARRWPRPVMPSRVVLHPRLGCAAPG